MATGGHIDVRWKLVDAGGLTLKCAHLIDSSGLVVSGDMLMVTDWRACNIQVYRRHDGKLLATSDTLDSGPSGICFINDMEICVVLENSTIQIMSIEHTGYTGAMTRGRTLHAKTTFKECHGVARFLDKVVVSGWTQDNSICWCLVSLNDGHISMIHQICKGDLSYLTTKDEMIYISCYAGSAAPDNTGVYGYYVQNPSKQTFRYKHKELNFPRGITVDNNAYIFVCNWDPPCIHHLTDNCELVTIYREGIPPHPQDIFCDQEILHVLSYWSNVTTRYKPVYSHQQGDQKASEVRDEIIQPVIEEISAHTEQGIVDKGHSSADTEMSPSVPVPKDSEDDKQDPVIPVEILRMDDKSLQLYKKALEDGKVKVYNIRVMIVGQYGVGKTTLTKRLLGQQVDISERKSTEGIDVYKYCCKISLDTGRWIVQPEDSDELARLQCLVNVLTGQTERPEANGEQEGHREPIDQNHFSDSDDDDDTPTSTDVIIHHSDFSNIGNDDISNSSESDIDQEVDIASNQSEESSFVKAYQRPPGLEVSSVAILESGRHVTSSKGDAMMEFLQLFNEKAGKLNKSKVEHAALAMWDFAGQYVFYTTHQTFLTCRAIYLLVTDLSQHVTDFVTDDECYFDTEGVQLCQVQDLVEVWLNSIHCCAPSSATGTPVTSPDVGIPGTPPVILVGTHVDKIQEDKRQEVISKYFEQICCILKDKPTLQHLVDFVPIDNTQNTQLDHQLELLKTRIFQLASRQPYWGEEVPAKWLLLEEVLMKLKASGIKVISRIAVVNINKEGSVQIEESEELDLFLRFLHETGTIIYFSIEVLRENIVLDPQWLIDALKSLINAQPNLPKSPAVSGAQSGSSAGSNVDSAVTQKWSDFQEKGILTLELVDAVWTKENNPDLHANRDHILLIMEQLNIIAKPRSFSETGDKVENYFLTPCMLRQKSPKEVISPERDPQIVSTLEISCVFTGKFLPPPIFHRLLAACVSHWPVAQNKETSEKLIFCGCCVFDLDLFHRLILHYRNHVVFARITRMVNDEVKTLDAKLCTRVRKFITLNLSKIISYLGQNLQYSLRVQSLPSQNVPEPRMFQMWFTDEGHDPDAPIMPEHMNHARLCVALITVCGNALRKILLTNFPVPYKDIYQVILAKQVDLTRRQGKDKPLLNPDQIQLVFPDPNRQIPGIVEQFDLSLLYTLIRNISTVPAPLKGWGNDPEDQPTRDRSLGASVERIRSYRNHIGGHSADGKISQQVFEDYWSKIDAVLHDIEAVIGNQVYSLQLEKQKRQVISIYEA